MHDKTAILMILDRSGSMGPLVADTVGGFNSFIKEQKELPGDAEVTLVLFNHDYLHVWTKNLKDIELLTDKDYRPMGNTALFDAVGRAVDELGKRLDETPEEEKPTKVIVVIMTDGEENSSREYTSNRVKEMVEHQRMKYRWEFIFLGANIDTFAAAGRIGILSSHAASFTANGEGTIVAYDMISRSVGATRLGGSGEIERSQVVKKK